MQAEGIKLMRDKKDNKLLTTTQKFNSKNIKKSAAWYENDKTPIDTQSKEKCIHYCKLELKYFSEVEVEKGLCSKEFGLCILDKSILKCEDYEEVRK